MFFVHFFITSAKPQDIIKSHQVLIVSSLLHLFIVSFRHFIGFAPLLEKSHIKALSLFSTSSADIESSSGSVIDALFQFSPNKTIDFFSFNEACVASSRLSKVLPDILSVNFWSHLMS
ncbi:MAG: hypothetical protein LBQ24_02835 [Candidatus Peribacteria bacterium]|nr:hypothetical protein [Candidatus Peribacteria bacterium]